MIIRYNLTFILVIFIIPFLFFSLNGIIPLNFVSSQPTQPNDNLTSYKTVNYYARFNCGTISDDSGPLRPGKYDSDITIFNKKSYPITVIWKAIEINQQERTNFNIFNIPSENIVNINCAKIFTIQNNNISDNLSNEFTEGIIKLEISINNGLLVNNFLNNQQVNTILNESEIGNLINVDVLHTVNTLDDLNKEVVYLKTDFSTLSKDKSKISNYTAIFNINPDEFINPLSLIKDKISKNNTNEKIDVNVHEILLTDTEIISDTLTDNHALTVQRVDPIIS
jgi:hypothetical protein